MVNLSQLKALDALEQTRSHSKAARMLGLTQPAVSIQLRRLQAQCGLKLFWRWGRKIEFSPLGMELALKARKIKGLMDDFTDTLSSASDLQSGQLMIGLSCHYFVMDLLSLFMARYPGVQVSARIDDSVTLIDDIMACRLDLAEVTATRPDERLFNLLFSEQSIVLFVAAHHPWTKHSVITVEKLDDQPMVARHVSSVTRQIFQRRLERQDIRPRVVLELDAWEALKEAVAAGIGFGIALEDEFIHDDRLAGITVADIDLSARQYFVCLPEFAQLRTVTAFFDLVEDVKAARDEAWSMARPGVKSGHGSGTSLAVIR
jgi:DNA-binding transcriptional LysR family regulator